MIAGDGIGPEISTATKQVLNAANQVFKLNLEIEDEIAGHESLKKYGSIIYYLQKNRALVVNKNNWFIFDLNSKQKQKVDKEAYFLNLFKIIEL